jgi:hypothetical protein
MTGTYLRLPQVITPNLHNAPAARLVLILVSVVQGSIALALGLRGIT